ncbi:RHS repeat-associated core domain-containing protein [Lottiidibacillus patelloidae]|uniref:RHS repeat-associated core domain-containing protein n=1 Tax=Lottiidibacillus patelloidae TaxID=2670334 RepID=UPI0018E9DF47|nr:RHS repeat-associated core domain-containing protein [Lottiidibacillus patelloidae]
MNGVTTNYYLEGSHVTYETNGTDEIYYTYDSKLISMNLNGEEYFYVYNLQGDVVGLLDSSGTEVVSYTYDTWGKVISITGTKASTVGEKNPYRYRGYRYDSETGLYYLNARYYNPEWGRMLNADSFGGFTGELLSHNVYAYVQNNPVMLYDPTGHFSEKNYGFGVPMRGKTRRPNNKITKTTNQNALKGKNLETAKKNYSEYHNIRKAEKGTKKNSSSPDFIVSPVGTAIPVPKGAKGPGPVENGLGFLYKGGSGGNVLNNAVKGVRIMEPTWRYPTGYASYFNKSNQAVNPITGRTIGKSDPWWHIVTK